MSTETGGAAEDMFPSDSQVVALLLGALAREAAREQNERAEAWWRSSTCPSRDQRVPAADRPGGARDATRLGVGEACAPLALVRTL